MRLLRGGAREELPVAWDGQRIEWLDGATPVRAVTHVGATPCSGCGSTTEPMDMHVGRVDPEPGATFQVTRAKRTKSGREYFVTDEVPAWSVARLFLYRCLSCGHDEVYDRETDQMWELDDSDFGDDGSWPDQPTLPLR